MPHLVEEVRPPHACGVRIGGAPRWLVFLRLNDANALLGVLAAHGLVHHGDGVVGIADHGLAGVVELELLGEGRHVEDGLGVLRVDEQAGGAWNSDPLGCPVCGSLNITTHDYEGRFVCENCGHRWK